MKKNLLKVLALVLCLAMVFSFVACGKTEEAPEESTETQTDDTAEAPLATAEPEILTGEDIGTGETLESLSIGFTVSQEKEFETSVHNSLQAACDEKGYELKIGVHGGDTTKQRSFVEAFINAGVNICMDFASNAETGAALTDLCVEAGIPMIGIDADYGDAAYYFGTNNVLCGTTNGKILGEWVRDNWDGKVDKFVRFNNPEYPPILQSRTEGGWDAFCEVLPEYADKKDEVFVDTCYVNNDSLITQQNVRDWFTQQPDDVTSAWISLSDNDIQVAVTEIQSMGKEKQCVCVSNDCTKVFVEQIIKLKGDTCWVSSLNFRPDNYGGLLVMLAEKILSGQEVAHFNSFELPGCNYSNVQEMFPEKWEEVTATM